MKFSRYEEGEGGVQTTVTNVAKELLAATPWGVRGGTGDQTSASTDAVIVSQSRTQSSQASWSAGGHRERLWGNGKN